MRSLSRRFGIAALSVALMTTLIGSTQAGIIPWVYNVFYGPVGYGPAGYGAPAYPYAYPMAGGFGCGPCRTPVRVSCRPSPCSPCSSGSCPTYVSYGPRSSCEVGREVTRWKSDEVQTRKANEVTKRAPSPVDTPPAPKTTFTEENGTAADSAESASETAAEVAAEAAPGDINVPPVPPVKTPAPARGLTTTGTGDDNPGFVTTPPPAATTETPDTSETPDAASTTTPPAAPGTPGGSFIPPKPGAVPDEKETGTPAPTLPPDALKPANLDGETSWKLTVPNRRLVRQVNYRSAQIGRRSVVVNSEYVIPSESVAHIVTRD